MNSDNFDWNTQYGKGRDYKWLSTNQLTRVLGRANITNVTRALDIGCGTGQLCRDLVHRGFTVRGIDISSTAIDQARGSTTLPSSTIEFDVCDIEQDVVDLGVFDVIFCKYTLSFIGDKNKFLQKVVLLKARGGLFVVVSPNLESIPEHKQNIAMKHEYVVNLLSEYFESVSFDLIDTDYYYYAR